MLQLISLFKEQRWEVVFASPAQDSAYMEDLHKLDVATSAITLNSDSFNSYLKNLNPTIVLFDRFMMEEQFGWRVEAVCPKAVRILDCEDLHCLRQSRQRALKENRTFELIDLLDEEMAKREIASILRSDLTLVISEFEVEVLDKIFKCDKSLLHYLPLFSLTIDNKELPSFEQRKDFVFVGNFLHNPNTDAVLFLKNDIWPKLRRQLPRATMQIYGAYPSQKILQLHQPLENFHVNGRIDEASAVVSHARVVFAPLRFGAGIKGKLLEAMQYGTPSITTAIGAEGMTGGLPWNGLIADDVKSLSNAAVTLYEDKQLWKQSQLNGFEIINLRHLKSSFADEIIKRILDLQLNIKHHRTNNFIGAMLRHHSMKSTEYLSRWIAEKNKS